MSVIMPLNRFSFVGKQRWDDSRVDRRFCGGTVQEFLTVVAAILKETLELAFILRMLVSDCLLWGGGEE